jgi:hypothetical protein
METSPVVVPYSDDRYEALVRNEDFKDRYDFAVRFNDFITSEGRNVKIEIYGINGNVITAYELNGVMTIVK